jgi:hypothetical protein
LRHGLGKRYAGEFHGRLLLNSVVRDGATSVLRARDEITESKEKNPAAGRNAGKESGVYA